MIAKLMINVGGDDSLDLWFFRESDGFAVNSEAALGVPDLSIANADWGDGITHIWAGRTVSNTIYLDDIRITDNFGELPFLVPEPTSMGLILVGALAFLAKRRARLA